MPLNPTNVVPTHYWAVQYDGTNAQDITSWLGGFLSEDSGTWMQMFVNDKSYALNLGDWAAGTPTTQGILLMVLSDAQYDDAYTAAP